MSNTEDSKEGRIFKGDSPAGDFFRDTYGTGPRGFIRGAADVASGGRGAGISALKKVFNKIRGKKGEGGEAPKTPDEKEEKLTRMSFKKGGKVRGAGIARKGVRPAKMVKMKGS